MNFSSSVVKFFSLTFVNKISQSALAADFSRTVRRQSTPDLVLGYLVPELPLGYF